MKKVEGVIKKITAVCLCTALFFTMMPSSIAFAAQTTHGIDDSELQENEKRPDNFYKALTIDEMLNLANKNQVYDMYRIWDLIGEYDPIEFFGLDEIKAAGGRVNRHVRRRSVWHE